MQERKDRRRKTGGGREIEGKKEITEEKGEVRKKK